jgi:hypothetical protein
MEPKEGQYWQDNEGIIKIVQIQYDRVYFEIIEVHDGFPTSTYPNDELNVGDIDYWGLHVFHMPKWTSQLKHLPAYGSPLWKALNG